MSRYYVSANRRWTVSQTMIGRAESAIEGGHCPDCGTTCDPPVRCGRSSSASLSTFEGVHMFARTRHPLFWETPDLCLFGADEFRRAQLLQTRGFRESLLLCRLRTTRWRPRSTGCAEKRFMNVCLPGILSESGTCPLCHESFGPMRIIIPTIGPRGDMQPCLALARACARPA